MWPIPLGGFASILMPTVHFPVSLTVTSLSRIEILSMGDSCALMVIPSEQEPVATIMLPWMATSPPDRHSIPLCEWAKQRLLATSVRLIGRELASFREMTASVKLSLLTITLPEIMIE